MRPCWRQPADHRDPDASGNHGRGSQSHGSGASNRAAFLKSTLEGGRSRRSAGFFLGLASLNLRSWLSLKQRAHAPQPWRFRVARAGPALEARTPSPVFLIRSFKQALAENVVLIFAAPSPATLRPWQLSCTCAALDSEVASCSQQAHGGRGGARL